MNHQIVVNDKYWPEVETINGYAIFMGHLMMGIRGLGLLVLTWTTVVLLGGFVSMLQTKDFWCLTVIILVQTAGVFDFVLKEKASDVVSSLKGMLNAQVTALTRQFNKDKKGTSNPRAREDNYVADPSLPAIVLFLVAVVVQLVVLALVLCLVAVLCLLGLCISTGISLWRLIEHDYGNAEGGANLKPALDVLYSLAVAQGVVFGYKTIYDLVAKPGLVEDVASRYSLDTTLVSDYLDETMTGCMKDPFFTRGRNLVTYGVDLLMGMGSKSRHCGGYIPGVMILGTILRSGELLPGSRVTDDHFSLVQQGLVEQLLTGSASLSHMVHCLLETISPTMSPYSGEIREHAARIVAHVAGSIRLEEQPFGGTMIRCVSSMLNNLEECSWRPEGYERHNDMPKEYERDWLLEENQRRYLRRTRHSRPRTTGSRSPKNDSRSNPSHGYKGLVVQGLRILQKLAIDENNCRVIMNTHGLLAKIMAPLCSDQLHKGHHDQWQLSIAEESMELMCRLMAAPGETGGSKLPSEIILAGNIREIVTDLLGCSKCQVSLRRQAVKIALDLSVATPLIMSGGNNNTLLFTWLLLHISLLPDSCFGMMCGSVPLAKKSSYIRRLAGDELQAVLSSQTEAKSSIGDVIWSLVRTVVDAESHAAYRLHAVRILEDLCRHYTEDDEHLEQLKGQISFVLPKLLTEILGRGPTNEENQASSQAEHVQDSAPDTDLENGGAPQRHAQEHEGEQQNGEEHHQSVELKEALISLCRAIYHWDDPFLIPLAYKACSEHGITINEFFQILF